MRQIKLKSPVGNRAEQDMIWPRGWRVNPKNPFGVRYTSESGIDMGCHTGVDLIRLDSGQAGKPVYAIADGIIKYKKEIPNHTMWGRVIVIYHGMVIDEEDGKAKPLFSRYAHLQGFSVKDNELEVTASKQIGTLGSGPPSARMGAHLHFDMTKTDILLGGDKEAGHWPNAKIKAEVEKNYVDPEIWLRRTLTLVKDHHGREVSSDSPSVASSIPLPPVPSPQRWVVTIATQIRLGMEPNSVSFPIDPGASFLLENDAQESILENSIWVQISKNDDVSPGFWVKKKDNSQTYISRQ